MKFLKRIAVFVFIGFLCFNSVFFSYEKAYSSDAAFAPAIPVAYEAFVALLTLLGATAVVGCTWEYMDSLDENSTPKEWEKAYNQEKELYDNFKTYFIENEGSENLYITDASGQVCYLDDILENDFPDEKEFKELKKKSNKKKYDPGDWWQYADELLDLLSGFFNDEDEDFDGAGGGNNQSYYQDDSYYINRETGEINVFAYSKYRRNFSLTDAGYVWGEPYDYIYTLKGVVKEEYRQDFRVCFVRSNDVYSSFPFVGASSSSPYCAQNVGYRVNKNSAYSLTSKYIDNLEINNYILDSSGSQLSAFSAYQQILFCYYNSSTNLVDYKNYWYLSSNVPFLTDYDSATAYLDNGDASSAINLPPGSEPASTPVPGNPGTTNTTAVSTYCNSLRGKWVNSTTINNFVENLTTYIEENNITPDNTDPDYCDAVKQLANDDIVLSPTPTNLPYKGYEDDVENDGEGFSLWKFFEWLLDFFTIDMDLISSSIKVDFIPAASFKPLVDSFNKMKVAFGSDTYMNVQSDNELTVVDSTSISSPGTSPGTLVADYPVISCKVPKVLDKYLVVDGDVIKEEEGEKVIILCDFADYAVYFARFRAFLIAVMWIGMLFYLMREFQVTFNIS